MIKKIIYNLFNRLSKQAIDYEYRQTLKQFNIPSSVKINQVTLIGNIKIDEFTYINPYSVISSGEKSKVEIGKHCAIGRYVSITSKGHSFTVPTSDENHQVHEHIEEDTIIGNNVWIGDHVFIKHGINVGDYAIIGANSVLVKDVLPFEIVGGVPAQHIRFNTDHHLYNKMEKK